MQKNYSRGNRVKVLPMTLLYTAKTRTFPYQDPLEGENTGRHECTNGIGKVKRKVSNLQQQARYKTHRSSKNHLSMKYKKANTCR